MSLPLRPLIGFGAAFAAMATVAVAGLTAPAAKVTMHASAGCPAELGAPKHDQTLSGAERPA
jgi:hypothetical protein